MLSMKQSKGQGRVGFRKWIKTEATACHHIYLATTALPSRPSFTSASLTLTGSGKHYPVCQYCSPLALLTSLAGNPFTVKE